MLEHTRCRRRSSNRISASVLPFVTEHCSSPSPPDRPSSPARFEASSRSSVSSASRSSFSHDPRRSSPASSFAFFAVVVVVDFFFFFFLSFSREDLSTPPLDFNRSRPGTCVIDPDPDPDPDPDGPLRPIAARLRHLFSSYFGSKKKKKKT